MKTFLPILLLTSLGLASQTPPPPAPPAVNPKSSQEIPAPPGATNGPAAALKRLIPPTTRGPTPPPVPVVAPATGASAVPSPRAAGPLAPLTAPAAAIPTANPAATATPTAPGAATAALPAKAPEEQTIPPGHINWTGADLNQVLTIYSEMVGRSILRVAQLPAPQTIVFKNQTALTKQEAIQAINAVLALNGIAMINVGEKFVKAVPIAQANQEGAPFNLAKAEDLPDLGSYVTRIVQLKYIKPTEAMAAIQP